MGPNRDDCQDEAGTSYIDRQGCVDSNEDGYSDSYGGFRALVARIGGEPFTQLAFYGVLMVSFLISLSITFTLRRR
jgi:hypothetical protein